jgi:hypothetical protein
MSGYYPLLLVKDINSEGFTISNEFMTNADVPTLATDGVIDNPINPFTKKPINSDEKTAHPQYISLSHDFDIGYNCGNVFLPSKWVEINGDFQNKDKWVFIDDVVVLNDHKKP